MDSLLGAGAATAPQNNRPDRADLADPLSRGDARAAAPRRTDARPLPKVEWPSWASAWLAAPDAACYLPAAEEPTPAAQGARGRFPLGGLVRATVRLAVPRAGTLGVVVGHTALGEVCVRQAPGSLLAMPVPAAQLMLEQTPAPPPPEAVNPVPNEDEYDDEELL